MALEKKIADCPFCDGDFDGCCFCDHTGKIYIGDGEFFKSEEQLESIGVHFIKDNDTGEMWPEMYEHFMDEKNVPDYYKKQKQNSNYGTFTTRD